MKAILPAAGALVLALAGCTTETQSNPPRTATEQLLISSAADRAAEEVSLRIPKGSKLFVDATNFEGTDSKYAIGALRERLLKSGGQLVADRGGADYVVEIRSGALSIQDRMLVGIPKMQIPIPLAGSFSFPEIAFFKKEVRKGVAKFAATEYGAKSGQFADASEPRYGFSHETEWVAFLFITSKTTDILPEEAREPMIGLVPVK